MLNKKSKLYLLQDKNTVLNNLDKSINVFNAKSINNNNFFDPLLVINTNNNNPFILKKSKSAINKLSYINNDTGRIKHFTPVTQEWYNSVYSYNTNYTKLLPNADKNLISLLKSYFNLFLSNKGLKTKNISKRSRKLSANKIFVGKGDIKHNNEKIIITSYIYNAEQFYLKNLIRRITNLLYFPGVKLNKTIKEGTSSQKGKDMVTYNRPYTLEEYLNLPEHKLWHKNICFSLFWKQYKKFIGINKLKEEENNTLLKENITFKDKSKKIFFDAFSNDITFLTIDTNFYNLFSPLLKHENDKNKILVFKNKIIKYKKFFDAFDNYITLVSINYRNTFFRYAYLLMVNNAKFEIPFLTKLSYLIKKVYNKKIEFNLVNHNRIYLNSDIYTQIVTLKLKNKKNNLSNILTLALNNIKLSNASRISERYNIINRDEFLINKIRNKYINSMFRPFANLITTSSLNKTITNNFDSLNNLLSNFFGNKNELSSGEKQDSISYKSIVRSMKHNKLAGIRLEVKGRLTRRSTASRSLYKVKWKGGLKNVDSSFKGLSTVMLRGYSKSNIQYSIINSKSRNGAFGIKGWVSSK